MSCKMGVGCDEAGVCFAAASGCPDLCARDDSRSGWVRAIDDALVCWHIGVANENDSYYDAKGKLNTLLEMEVQVACDPAVNGGKVLVNQKQLKTLLTYFAQGQMPTGVRECLNQTLEEIA